MQHSGFKIPSIILVLFSLIEFPTAIPAQSYAIGADLSFLKSIEDQGYQFKEEGQPKAGLDIFADHGYNWIRLRLFHTPDRLPNNLEYTIALARAAKEKGMKFLLDYHYSDTWADPGKQYLPKAWEGLNIEQLVDSVFEYTRRTMIAFREAGVYPDMVQIGNEVIHGMMWPLGKLPENWDQFAMLTQAGINGVHASCGNQPCPQIMIHIDRGGDLATTKWFFDKFNSYRIEFDVIGQSYYPWWHGSLLDLRDNLYFMASTYHKPIWMVEVAYCSQPTEYKDHPGPFPESPEGQRDFLEAVHEEVLRAPDHLGQGVFWWEPAAMGPIGSRDFFDADGNVLPVIHVFDKWSRH